MEKWAQVIKYEFDLRIKGVLEYQLPLSQRVRRSSVDFETRIRPGGGKGGVDEGVGTPDGEVGDDGDAVRHGRHKSEGEKDGYT